MDNNLYTFFLGVDPKVALTQKLMTFCIFVRESISGHKNVPRRDGSAKVP